MRKSFLLIICLSFCAVIVGCASTAEIPVSIEEEIVEPVEVVKVPYFDDWQYRGFGVEYPEWAEMAYDNDILALKEEFPVMQQEEFDISIEKIYGSNLDICKRKAESVVYSENEAFPVAETWVCVNIDYEKLEESYVYIKVFLVNKEEVK